VAEGGEATLCDATFLGGVTDPDVEEVFRRDRAERYAQITREAAGRAAALPAEADPREVDSLIRRLRTRIEDVAKLDYFTSPGRAEADAAISRLQARLGEADGSSTRWDGAGASLMGAVWVTREDLHVDRIASAWLIRRFVDADARFKFVDERGYARQAGEIRFDMYDAEFTHEGDRCTFETLVERLRPDDVALRAVSEVVHDIDLKAEKFGRPETSGVERLVAGVAEGTPTDEARIERGAVLFEGLYRGFGGAG
jgi:hypothetical protein